MIRIQEKFFKLLDQQAEQCGWEVATSFDYSNVGTIHIQPADSFITLATVRFDFQGDRVSLRAGEAMFWDRPNQEYASWDATNMDGAIQAIIEAAQTANA